MKRFVKHLLPLGALLAVTAMPAQAAAAEQPSANLDEVLKLNTKYTIQSNADINELLCKWAGNHAGIDCDDLISDLINNCWKPNIPNRPNRPGQGGDIENPEVPDVDVPEQPEVPDVDVPEWPEMPDVDVPNKPEVPEQPETPDEENGGQQGGTQLSAYERQVVELVNKERAAAGLSALKVNTKLSQVAERKAEDMRDNNYFSHTSPTYGSPFDMMKQFGITYKSAGENIAKGQKTPQSVMNGWMNSQGHKENILSSKYTEIGVGYVTDNSGNTYWVQMFIRP